MKQYFKTSFINISIILFFPFLLFTQSSKIGSNSKDTYSAIRYYGEVKDLKGKPIPNIEVKIICYTDGGKLDSTFKTNKLGKYDFKYNAYGEVVSLNFTKSNSFTISIVNIPTGFLQTDLGFNVIYDKTKSDFESYDKEWDLLLDCGSLHKTLGLDNNFKEILNVKDTIQQLKMYDSIVNYFNKYPINYNNPSFNDLAKSQIAYTLFWLNVSIGDKIGRHNLKHYNQRFFVDTLDINSPVFIHKLSFINNIGSRMSDQDKLVFLSKLTLANNPEIKASAYKERINLYGNLKDTVSKQNDIKFVMNNLQYTKAGKDIYYEYDETRPIKNGKKFVDFKLPLYEKILLNDSIDLGKLKGKYILIDFWATNCSPCLTEMKFLHQTYDELKDSNFTILSISIDNNVESAIKFRSKKWKMPWINVYASGGFGNQLLKKLGINGIPQAILINKEGIIIDEGKYLRGEKLNEFLKYALMSNM